MSTNHYEVVSSSGSEDELVVDETPKPSSKASRKRSYQKVIEKTRKTPTSLPRAVVSSDEEEAEEGPAPPPLPPKKKRYLPSEPAPAPGEKSKKPSSSTKEDLEQEAHLWQAAMEAAKTFMTPLKVDTQALTMLFDQATLDCFKKACQGWLHEKGLTPHLTYTSQKSFVTVMARFLFDFTLRHCHLEGKNNVNVTGAALWTHGCDSEVRCLHGTPMIQKEQVVEMDVTSENGQRALKEQPQKAKVTTNRWGRNIVQLRNSDALACVHDANSAPGNYNAKSCGVFYNDGQKALQSFRHIMSYQVASYPKMPQAGTRLLMPLKCECNYLNVGLPLLGRQTCKMTPFVLTGPQVDESCVSDPAVLASLRHPALLVFQCCNPVYRGSKASNQKNCDFKISATDVINALQLAKKFWSAYFPESPAQVLIPEFKWHPQYQYQNSILPTPLEQRDECLF